MKSKLLTPLLAAVVGLALLSAVGCSPKDTKTGAALPATPDATKATPAPGALPAVTPAAPGVTATSWTEVKDATFAQRTSFFATLAALENAVETQVRELTTLRAALPVSARTQDWYAAMKEMNDARDQFRAMVEEIKSAKADTWQQQKDKIGLAWTRTQDAYAKVKASATQ